MSGTEKAENDGLVLCDSFDNHQKVESRREEKKNLYQSHAT